jgi:hypothetical protein
MPAETKRWCRCAASLWYAFQVGFSGEYSLERLAEFVTHNDSTSHPRALVITIVFPLPCLIGVIVLD